MPDSALPQGGEETTTACCVRGVLMTTWLPWKNQFGVDDVQTI